MADHPWSVVIIDATYRWFAQKPTPQTTAPFVAIFPRPNCNGFSYTVDEP
jgi:hypothetical protein